MPSPMPGSVSFLVPPFQMYPKGYLPHLGHHKYADFLPLMTHNVATRSSFYSSK